MDDTSAMSSRELARRIQASIRADACRVRAVEHIGEFIATFHREDANPFLNYAIPDEDARPADRDVEALVAAYRRRNRTPRLEYLPMLAPAVEHVLAAHGFTIEGRLPLMTCASTSQLVTSEVDDIELLSASTEDDYRAVAAVQWEAYDEQGVVPQRVVDALVRGAESGGIVVLARDAATGEPAGAGQCTPPQGPAELTSVGVRSGYRRRGIAQALTSRLAHDALATGAESVFLMAAGVAEARIYERAGFRRDGEVLLMSLPA